jgi:LPS-assembly protein
MVGRGYHDFTFQRELESMAGVEYNSCCYRMRIVARRWLDNDLANVINDEELEYDKGIFFEFQLKGLGGIGSKVSGILSDGIYGYDRREENQK